MLLNVAYYAIDPPLLFHVMLSIKIKIMIKYYNSNVISLFLLYWSIKNDSIQSSIECSCCLQNELFKKRKSSLSSKRTT